MRSSSINSRIASQRSHSLTLRCTFGSGVLRRSGRGGKSGAQTSTPFSLLAFVPFQPDQKTEAQHDGDRVAMKAIPATALILIPAQLRFRFFMILLHPVAAMRILHDDREWGLGWEVAPEVFPVSARAASGTLTNQPAAVSLTITIDAPTAQSKKLGPPPSLTSLAPGDGLPGAQGLRREDFIHALHPTLLPAAQGDTEIRPDRHHVSFLTLFQSVKKMGIITIIRITGDTTVRHATLIGFIQQGQRDLSFSLKRNLFRDVRFLAAHRILRPLAGQIEPGGNRPGERALSIMTIDADLTIGQFSGRPGILARDAHRVLPLLFKTGVIKDEGTITFALDLQHPGHPLPIERAFIPDHLGQQMVELLLIGLRHNLGQRVAILVRVLAEQPGDILPQRFSTRPLRKMHPQGGEEIRQFRQRRTRRLWQTILILVSDDHVVSLSYKH